MRSPKEHVKDFLSLLQRPTHRRSRLPVRRPPLHLEALETRLVPYSVSGNAWPHPELVTLSFVPDGTNLGGATSNLFATFNGKFGSAATWRNQILKAAQVWAQQTNLNFSFVSDNGNDECSGNSQQGDPGFGDIRFSGFNFGSSSALAMAYMPPSVNNYSVAGDVSFNTGQAFNINTTYDLFTVAMHEMGHALGLYHSDAVTAVMNANYTSKMSGPSSDDIAGIRNIYSNNNARSADTYDAAASNGTFSTASDITAQINTASQTALLNNLDITTTSDQDYYKLTAPAGSSSSLTVTVQSKGLSLLAPTLTVYNGSQTQLATISGAGHYGTSLNLTINGITAGSTYYVKVAGADTTALGTGKYALTLNLGTGASPTVPLPNTQTANGNPISGGGGQAFSPNIIQAVSSGLLGGLLNGLTGILWDAAGAFDLLEVPGVNSLSHRPGCCCPNCRQSVAAEQNALPGADSSHVNLLSDDLQATGNQTPSALLLADPLPTANAWQTPDDHSMVHSMMAATASNRDDTAMFWSQESEAYFANRS